MEIPGRVPLFLLVLPVYIRVFYYRFFQCLFYILFIQTPEEYTAGNIVQAPTETERPSSLFALVNVSALRSVE